MGEKQEKKVKKQGEKQEKVLKNGGKNLERRSSMSVFSEFELMTFELLNPGGAPLFWEFSEMERRSWSALRFIGAPRR